jgi:hypothetical protein
MDCRCGRPEHKGLPGVGCKGGCELNMLYHAGYHQLNYDKDGKLQFIASFCGKCAPRLENNEIDYGMQQVQEAGEPARDPVEVASDRPSPQAV